MKVLVAWPMIHGRELRARPSCGLPSVRSACFFVSTAGLLLGFIGTASAATPYSTERVLENGHNACLQATDCKEVRTKHQRIKGNSAVLSFQCPSSHPYLVGWDAKHHEHISASVLPAQTTANGLSLAVENHADVPGSITVFLGCSEQPSSGVPFMDSIAGVPTNTSAVDEQ